MIYQKYKYILLKKKYAQKSTSPVTLKQLIKFGQSPLSHSALLDSARDTRLELPVRLARHVKAKAPNESSQLE